MSNTLIINGDARNLNISDFQGPYKVILADCPWRYTQNESKKSPNTHYKDTMILSELEKMPVGKLAAKDSVLFQWGTWPKLPDALRLFEAWGFKYATGFPWIKTGIGLSLSWGTGYWIRGVSEFVLIGKRGKAGPTKEMKNYAGLIAENLVHSRKPKNIHELAETLPGPYLELFAREPRKGWTVFGNEVEDKTKIGFFTS